MAVERFDIVIPLVNRSCKIGSKVPISLSNNVSVHTIRADHLATISAQSESSRATINGSTKVVLETGIEVEPTDAKIANLIRASVFCLDFFSTDSAASVGEAYIVRNLRKQSLGKTIRIGGYDHNSSGGFVIDKGTDFSPSEELFRAAIDAIEKDPSMKISIARFCAAVAKRNSDEKIIDMCICLESIFNSDTEISFRFSLYNTLLSQKDEKERLLVFKLLKKLYNLRSKIVHGSSEGDDTWVNENWAKIVSLAKLSLVQKMDFLRSNVKANWQDHLDRLALGVKEVEAV